MGKVRTVLALVLLSAFIINAIPIFVGKAQETLLWEADVFSTGAPVSSPGLGAGTEYSIVAKGVWWDANKEADAQYYTPDPTVWWIWDPLNTLLQVPSFLLIDGNNVDWGPFSNGAFIGDGHEYTISYTGTGAAITFTIVDWIDGNNADNTCHIHVQIYERPPTEEGLSPGYWKKAFNAFGALIIGPPEKNQGSIKEAYVDLMAWTVKIDSASRLPTTPWNLPPLAEIDYDSDGTFEMEDAYNIFNDHGKPWNTMWIDVANWYNWAAGYGYYNG